LQQYILERRLKYVKSGEQAIDRRELAQRWQPQRTFRVTTRIWLARNWLITKRDDHRGATYSCSKYDVFCIELLTS
jgi:hypothetical protein